MPMMGSPPAACRIPAKAHEGRDSTEGGLFVDRLDCFLWVDQLTEPNAAEWCAQAGPSDARPVSHPVAATGRVGEGKLHEKPGKAWESLEKSCILGGGAWRGWKLHESRQLLHALSCVVDVVGRRTRRSKRRH